MQRAEMTEAIANEAGRRFHFVHSVAPTEFSGTTQLGVSDRHAKGLTPLWKTFNSWTKHGIALTSVQLSTLAPGKISLAHNGPFVAGCISGKRK